MDCEKKRNKANLELPGHVVSKEGEKEIYDRFSDSNNSICFEWPDARSFSEFSKKFKKDL